MRAPLVLVALLLSGCLTPSPPRADPPAGDGESWMLYGTFAPGYTHDDIRAVCAAAGPEGAACGMMESDPPQFGFGYSSRAECETARGRVVAVPRAIARECAPSWQATPYGVAQWRFSGAFTEDRTDEDVRDVCRVGARNETCALMESFPEQFSFLFASRPLCEEARDEVAAHPRTQGVTPCRSEGGDLPPEAATPTGHGPARDYDVRTFDVTWTDPDEGRSSDQKWDVVRAWSQGDLVTINVTTHGIEGGDFRLQLWMRAAQTAGSARLAHAKGAPDGGTFDFAYTEAVFWAGRPITRVASVDERSHVTLLARDADHRLLAGSFLLDFVGVCETDCVEGDAEPRRTILEGRFGP